MVLLTRLAMHCLFLKCLVQLQTPWMEERPAVMLLTRLAMYCLFLKCLAQPRHNFPFRRRTHWKPSWWHDRKFGLLWYDCPCWRSAPDVRSDLESNGATVYSDQTMEPRSPRDSEGSVTSESRKRPPCYGSTIDRLRCLRRRTWDLGIEDEE